MSPYGWSRLIIGRGRRFEDNPAVRTAFDTHVPYSRILVRYALSELQKDVEEARQLLPEDKREGSKTQFAIFVVHNKLKPKVGSLPEDVS